MPYAGMLYFMPLDPIHCIISKVEVMAGEEMGNISISVDSGSSLSSMGTKLKLLAKISMFIILVCNVMDTSLVDICHLLVCLMP